MKRLSLTCQNSQISTLNSKNSLKVMPPDHHTGRGYSTSPRWYLKPPLRNSRHCLCDEILGPDF